MKPGKQKSTISSKEKTLVLHSGKFPIMGIGASAGGLEAFEQFFGSVPENSMMAYVVIQHLDPTQKGMLPELLQRTTKMKVFQTKDRMVVKPNCVYVIPPNKSMSILKGKLHLFEPIEARGMRLPVDFFFRSLADDQKELGIGLILSGMGSDGSIGLRALKEKNGIVMVQDPENAKFDSMPRNAINSLQIDIVAPASELYAQLIDFLKYVPIVKKEIDFENKTKSALEKIIILLRMHTGNDFSLYKKNTMYRRIERRMGVHKIDNIASYVIFLQENPKEAVILFKELMIGVTSFFRDTVVWEKLKETIIPDIIAQVQTNLILRAWIPGCSTGEEAYSLAIVFKEALKKINSHKSISLQIFATDLDNESIETARKGIFPAKIVSDVTPDRLKHFFIRTDEGYHINSEIREMIVFAQHNIIMHPPFTKIDIISCRNLLIYMNNELQKKLLSLFYYSINPEGILLLGNAETPGTMAHLFKPVDAKLKIFKRSANNLIPEIFDFPSSFSRTKQTYFEEQIPAKSLQNIQTLADQLLIQHFSPAGVLVNENGDVIYISKRTGKYLEPSVGKANMNIFAMLREGLRNEFSIAFRKALKNKETVVLHNIKVATNGEKHTIDVKIQRIEKPEPLYGMVMVIFIDIPEIDGIAQAPKNGKKMLNNIRESGLAEELQRAREEAQNIMEEMQTSQEELKTTNEELQSANEELQSANEELTTSKEEMQSLNEELQTVNAELQSKVDEFTRVDNDMKNLLNSIDIATLFLDKELNIRRYTIQANKIFKLIKSDIGRPFTDQVSDLEYPELVVDALEVLRTLVFKQKQVPAKDGRWFSIRIMPYRTFDDRIDGLVITFINITELKKLETELHETEKLQRLLLNSTSDVIIKLSTSLKILEFNTNAERFFNKKCQDVLNQNFIHLLLPESSHKKIEKDMNKMLHDAIDKKFKLQIIAAGGKMQVVEWSLNLFFNEQNIPAGIFMIYKKKLSNEQQ